MNLNRPGCAIIAVLCMAAWADLVRAQERDENRRHTFGTTEMLVVGESAIRAGRYDDGIRITLKVLEHGAIGVRDRVSAYLNLCRAYVALEASDDAIHYCSEALALDETNWRSYTHRARAHFQKGMFAEAIADNDAAAALNPQSGHVRMMRSLLDEHRVEALAAADEHR